jgi:hypothetical protein
MISPRNVADIPAIPLAEEKVIFDPIEFLVEALKEIQRNGGTAKA